MPDTMHLRMAEMPPLKQAVAGMVPYSLGATTWTIILGDILDGNLDHVAVFTFRDRAWRMWHLPGTTVEDDLVSAILRHEQAEGVVVVHPIPVPPGVDAKETMNLAVESPHGKHDLLIAMKSPGIPSNYRLLDKTYPPEVPRRWLGVQPSQSFDDAIDRVAGWMGSAKGEA